MNKKIVSTQDEINYKKGLKILLKETENAMQTLSENIMEQAKTWGNSLEADADQFVSELISGIMCGSIPVPRFYQDSDQSPLFGNEGQFIKNMWAMGMDYAPYEPIFIYHSDWLRTIWSGDYEGFLDMIESKEGEELDELLNRRETLLNVSAIFHVVIGARVLGVGNSTRGPVLQQAYETLNVKNDHMKILIKLLCYGVDVNVHDIAGFTPLHHCFTAYGNEVTFKMGERLIRAGAKVDAPNRLGETPLYSISQTPNYDAISLLLEHGANPYKQDNGGFSAFSNARINPKMNQLFGKYYKKRVKEHLKDPNFDSPYKCNNCGDKEKDIKKCSGCFLVWYCSQKCQREHWSQHADQCKKSKDLYKIAKFPTRFVSSFCSINTKPKFSVPPAENRKLKKTHFIVKVQVSLSFKGGTKADKKGDLTVYNKDRSFTVFMPRKDNEYIHGRLFENIINHGHEGMKGYFHVILEPGDKEANQFRINPENISIEPW